MLRSAGLALCLLVALTLPTGCLWYQGQFDPLQYGDSFDEAQKRFTRLVRWNQFEKASELVDPEVREAFLGQAEALRGVRFTDYEVLVVDLDDELRSATVDVVFHAYDASMIEKSIGVRQEWTRDAPNAGWWVRPELTGLTHAFPANMP